MTKSRFTAILSVIFSLTLLTGCGLGSAGGYTPSGTLAGPVENIDLSGADISVGSKNFTEQVLLGKMAIILLQSAGAETEDLTSVPGASTSRQAQLDGAIDFQWEYTGNGWINYLGHDDPVPGEREQYEAVREGDLENGLVWLPPAAMNNTYGFAAPREVSERLGVTKLSDLTDLPESELTFCVESEFESRNDGFQPMLELYGLSKPQVDTSVMDTGAIYAATAGGTCNFGEVFTTDGRIAALNLVNLDDDLGFFPKYNLSGVVRAEVLEEFPQIAELFDPVVEKLDDDTMIALNGRIDIDGEDPAEVALDWLREEGFLTN